MNWDAAIAIGLKLLAVALLVLFNAFFVAAELAFVRIRDTQLASLAARGQRRARKARRNCATGPPVRAPRRPRVPGAGAGASAPPDTMDSQRAAASGWFASGVVTAGGGVVAEAALSSALSLAAWSP